MIGSPEWSKGRSLRVLARFAKPVLALLAIAAGMANADPPKLVQSTDWVKPLTSLDADACLPSVTDQWGDVRLICQVEATGGLANCNAVADRQPHLRDFAMCLSQRMQVRPKLAGQTVEVRLRLGK